MMSVVPNDVSSMHVETDRTVPGRCHPEAGASLRFLCDAISKLRILAMCSLAVHVSALSLAAARSFHGAVWIGLLMIHHNGASNKYNGATTNL
eukprot:g5050.t1